MSHDHDHPTERPFYADPNARVGGLVYRLGESEYADFAPYYGIVALLSLFALAHVPGWVRGPLALFSFVSFIGGLFVAEAATDRICPRCEYPQPEPNRYCASCGVNFEEVDER